MQNMSLGKQFGMYASVMLCAFSPSFLFLPNSLFLSHPLTWHELALWNSSLAHSTSCAVSFSLSKTSHRVTHARSPEVCNNLYVFFLPHFFNHVYHILFLCSLFYKSLITSVPSITGFRGFGNRRNVKAISFENILLLPIRFNTFNWLFRSGQQIKV